MMFTRRDLQFGLSLVLLLVIVSISIVLIVALFPLNESTLPLLIAIMTGIMSVGVGFLVSRKVQEQARQEQEQLDEVRKTYADIFAEMDASLEQDDEIRVALN